MPAGLRVAIAVGTAALCGALAVAQERPDAVDVRLDRVFAPEAIDAIARLGRPEEVSLPAGGDFVELVTERCGRVDPAYVAAFLRENPTLAATDLATFPDGSAIMFPACARPPPHTPHRIQRRENIGALYNDQGLSIDAGELIRARPIQLLETTMSCLVRIEGVASGADAAALPACSAERFVELENTRQFLASNPDVDPRRLQVDQEIRLPQDPVWSTIVLREGVALEAAIAEIRRALASDGGAPAGRVTGARTANLIADTPLPEGSCVGSSENSPFSTSELAAALERNSRLRPPRHERPATVTVMVLDTGLDHRMLGRAIPPGHHARMRSNAGGPKNSPGINIPMHSADPTPPWRLPNRLHGSEVAALVLGGQYLETVRDRLGPIRVAFASIAHDTGDGVYLSSTAIYGAFDYADWNDIDIINASVSAIEDRQPFRDALDRSNGAVLFITAAGNEGSPFSSADQTWPGTFGGNPANAGNGLLVTVGSHDPSRRISVFSRRGFNRVDLLAPGCALSTFTAPDASQSEVVGIDRSGTSYAAPVVSFVAALLRLEGMTRAAIKTRLITSVDVDGALDTLVWSRGLLNMTRALTVWEDFVEYRVILPDNSEERRRAHGRLLSDHRQLILCNEQPITHRSLLKLSWAANSARPDDPRQYYAWQASEQQERPQDIIRHNGCATVRGEDFVFTDSATGQNINIAPANIVEFVARYR
ncbi:MAG TPA: S8 family serine peptidase [Allosphingosinicella sp.]|nr:S8 family serine peptidase [Allosphingosinicella sp.]